MLKDGALLSFDDARALSARLHRLADQCPEIWSELDKSGHGLAARVFRDAVRQLAGDDETYQQVVLYWIEYAKERLAGLVGPMDVLAGDIPKVAAYRSQFLEDLRRNAKAGRHRSVGPIVSPQIEPTLKRYVEMLPDDPFKKGVMDRIKVARQEATSMLRLQERAGFRALSAIERYELLVERYSTSFQSAGFNLGSHRKRGVVYRKTTGDGRWAFVFTDESRDGMDGGRLDTRLAITLPKKAILPGAVAMTAAATFSPVDLVPGFAGVCGFDRSSYAQLCLAADANAQLAKSVFVRLNKLLLDESGRK
jgi:hypothetical protein